MGFFNRATPAAPVQGDEAPQGAYRIKLTTTGNYWWWWTVYDHRGREVQSDYGSPLLEDNGRERSLKKARRWVDNRIRMDRARASAEGYEEWYGETVEGTRKIIQTQKTYIEELEERLRIGQHDDIQEALDGEPAA